ncbi:hypothetical protein ANN_23081 [Periplaneta americana]|uniref:DUF4817 domain-containing protein n=1 Tax=Periplaneta americana TaxID=6978 RepID=A0ABQ8SK33_PERAM|nr:hypothetical protein ANN_23081 [Periplaneta americana]
MSTSQLGYRNHKYTDYSFTRPRLKPQMSGLSGFCSFELRGERSEYLAAIKTTNPDYTKDYEDLSGFYSFESAGKELRDEFPQKEKKSYLALHQPQNGAENISTALEWRCVVPTVIKVDLPCREQQLTANPKPVFVSTKSIVAVQREFRRIFGDNQRGVAPSRKIISVWVRQWRETGSVQNKARVRQKTARTPDNVERVRTALQRSPYRSVRRNWNIQRLWFQQDGATSHTARSSMNTLRAAFPGRLISRLGDIQWPSVSPDLTAPDFFLWGYLKSKVYGRILHDIEDLKTAIREEIADVTPETLRRVMAGVQGRLQQCIDANGGHLKDIIFKT